MAIDSEKIIHTGKWYAEFDEQGTCTHVHYDASYCRLLGYSDEVLREDDWHVLLDSLHPEDAPRVMTCLKETLEGHSEGMDFDQEYRMMTKWGYHWFHHYGHCVRREDGTAVSLDSVVFDIQDTVDKQANYGQSVSIANFMITKSASAYYWNLSEGTMRVLQRDGASAAGVKGMLQGDCEVVFFKDIIPVYVKNNVHPDDKAMVLEQLRSESIRGVLQETTSIEFSFRDVSAEGSGIYRCVLMRGEDADHVVLLFWNITEQFLEQQKRILGAIPLSPDILAKANIGLWAFELDDGKEPRMYVDDTMLGLIGLTEQKPPEEIYHAWYDHVDKDSYNLVNDAVAKMSAGQHAEVQYPWHHPDGHTMIVRCGGILNPKYTQGLRVEGTHHDVSTVIHFQEETARRVVGYEKVLAAEFHVMYYLDLVTCKTSFIHGDEEARKFMPIFEADSVDAIYKNFHKLYVDTAVVEEDRERVKAVMNVENMFRVLKDNSSMSVNYKVRRNLVDPVYTEMRIFKAGEENGKLTAVILAFRLTDAELRNALEVQAKLREDAEIIGGLASGYVTLYFVNIKEGTLKIYSLDGVKYSEPKTYVREDGNTFAVLQRFGQSELVHPDDRHLFASLDDTAFRKRLAHSKKFSVRYRRKHGEAYLWSEMEAVKYEDIDEEANVIAVGFTERDEEIRTEMSRQAELARRTAISDYFINSYSTAYYCDIANGHISVLHAEPQLMEFCAGKVLDYRLYVADYIDKYVHSDDQERMRVNLDPDTIRKRLAEADDFSFNYEDIAEPEPGIYRCTIMRGEDSDHVGIGFKNITEDMRKEQEHQRKIREYNRIIGALVEDFTCVNYVEITDDKYNDIAVNLRESPLLTRLIPGWDDEKHISRKLTLLTEHLVYEPDREKFIEDSRREKILEKLNKSESYFINSRFVIDNEINYYQMQISGVHENGSLVGFVLGFHSIDEQMKKELETQKQLKDALSMAESASRAKTTFLNSMSHDIRTPMNAIIGFTSLASSHLDNKELIQSYLNKIGQSSEHLLSLINDVLDMSRIESGKMNLVEKPENLPDIIHALRDIVHADIHNKEHDFFIDTVNVNDDMIICDKLRLKQVLLNILSNSIKYTPNNGTISMRITEKTVKPSGYATYEFRIKDNGMGMDQEYLKTIFDPFTRVRSSTVSGIQGTGLGMAITKNIIDMMGGQIEIKSELGKGTEMIVTFDFKLHAGHKESLLVPELTGLRGLVVDDDADTCMSVAKMVKDVGMRSDWCTSGKEAVLRAEEAYRNSEPFKVYIIDLFMPGMNGIETTRRIRKAIGDDVPIIILTSYDLSDIEDDAREAGVTAFLNKPMFPSDLQQALNQCLGKKVIEEEPVPQINLQGRKVMLVEDNELNREIAEEQLSEYGLVVTSVEDGSIAVEKIKAAQNGDYDLILMDIQMPIMDGYEATKAIRALGTDISKIPIVAMTANAFEEDRKLALEAGMNEHLIKPVNIEKLKEVLTKFL